MGNIYVSPKLSVPQLGAHFQRADIELHSLDHAGASFEGRVFINRPDATAETPKEVSESYAGSFYVFGHGGCWGSVGHCEVKKRRACDPRPAHPLTPTTKVVIATDAVRAAVQAGGTELTVTVVAVVTSASKDIAVDDLLKFENLRLVTYE